MVFVNCKGIKTINAFACIVIAVHHQVFIGYSLLCNSCSWGYFFSYACMGALFAATIQAPMTGILLVIKLTHNYDFILPLMVSCLSACMVAQLESNPSMYSRFLEKLINQQKLN